MADLNPASPPPGPAHSQQWLQQLQAAADRHLLEKSQIRDTLGLLQVRVHVPQLYFLHFTLTMQIYHRAKEAEQEQKKEEKEISKRESPRKRLKTSKSEDTVD